MRYRDVLKSIRERNPSFLPVLLMLASLSALEPALANAQEGNSANAPRQNKSTAAASYKVPPLPNGSAQVNVTPGMSKKDWEEAYKETGRPRFGQSTVNRQNGNVERD
ncbi:hypothetical protein GCT13_36570 [Paraburkholderia sp. CNPSo 3157]|uniref:DUF4148 domain-containing protein n=1 Tax=Paraburkholderia franconis TaxID=2654983 RepID=A0A7X1NHP7_9BURK|nr:hypothetical protein [Paraburkholderia franconis]MPW22202.1 hypothetical protein [Paraburkholderia franconis]